MSEERFADIEDILPAMLAGLANNGLSHMEVLWQLKLAGDLMTGCTVHPPVKLGRNQLAIHEAFVAASTRANVRGQHWTCLTVRKFEQLYPHLSLALHGYATQDFHDGRNGHIAAATGTVRDQGHPVRTTDKMTEETR